MPHLDRRTMLRLLGLGGAGAVLPSGSAEAAAPDLRPVRLLGCWVAGFRHYEGERPDVAAELTPGAWLALRREPHNPYDPDALAVLAPSGAQVGYLPRLDNAVPAAVADAGIELAARVEAHDPDAPSWYRLTVGVYQLVRV